MYNVRLIFSLLILCTACSEDHASLYHNIHALDNNMPATGTYIIIPNQGCEGCISQAEAYVKKNITAQDNIRYIFTRIQSTKLLKIKLGADIMSSNKVLLDTANIIEYPDKKKEIYPMTVTLSNHKISHVSYQSP
jgi:hypothetical protein